MENFQFQRHDNNIRPNPRRRLPEPPRRPGPHPAAAGSPGRGRHGQNRRKMKPLSRVTGSPWMVSAYEGETRLGRRGSAGRREDHLRRPQPATVRPFLAMGATSGIHRQAGRNHPAEIRGSCEYCNKMVTCGLCRTYHAHPASIAPHLAGRRTRPKGNVSTILRLGSASVLFRFPQYHIAKRAFCSALLRIAPTAHRLTTLCRSTTAALNWTAIT